MRFRLGLHVLDLALRLLPILNFPDILAPQLLVEFVHSFDKRGKSDGACASGLDSTLVADSASGSGVGSART